MANGHQLAILRRGVENWNLWRANNVGRFIELDEADLHGANLQGVNLSDETEYEIVVEVEGIHEDSMHAVHHKTRLPGATLFLANLREADLSGADLTRANLTSSNMSAAKLCGANLTEAILIGANLREADLRKADLRGADLREANLRGANLRGANLTNCRVYGVGAWSLQFDDTTLQTNLCITPPGEAAITVDNLAMAQFIYLLLNNENIRQMIDAFAKKVVLILGRFTSGRKAVLDALRDELRRRNYLPIVFDFEKPSSRDLTETVSTLVHMARFVIADLTDAKSIGDELANVIPHLPSVAVQPLIQEDDIPYAMFGHWQRYAWVLDMYRYHSLESLLKDFKACVIDPAEQRANELSPQNENLTGF